MAEEELVSFAQVVEAGFPVGGGDEPVFGALPVAHAYNGAIPAIAGQGKGFGCSEGLLSRGIEVKGEGMLSEISQPVCGIHKMIATIEVPVVFHYRNPSTFRLENTEGVFVVEGCAQGLLEELDGHLSDIFFRPFVEDGNQEVAEGEGRDRSGRYWRGSGRSLLCPGDPVA